MTEEFAFNARQYFDFSQNQEDLHGDSFFEKLQNEDIVQVNGVNKDNDIHEELKEFSDTESDADYFSPLQMQNEEIPTSTVFLKSKMRRSLSLNSLPQKTENLEKSLDNLHIDDNRPASSCTFNSKKGPSQDLINKLAQPKRFTSSENLTLAEAVKKFQADTPKRFRSRVSPQTHKFSAIPWGGTKAQTPKLMTKQRTRPTHVLSHEEKEKLEAEAAKMFKIKAHPVNKKVMKGPMKPPIEKRPPTVIEPFKLTEVKKTGPFEVQKIPSFKAQPLPKTLQNPFKLQSNPQPTTVPQTPSFVKKLNKSLPKADTLEKVDAGPKPFKPSITKPQPFSFERRDQQIQKKKEGLINKVLEEEKKAREFHAKPPPKAILRARNRSVDDMHSANVRQRKNEETDTATTFKAKPPKVLYVEPFQPKKNEYHDVKIEPFQLSTDERAQSRKKFEQWLKEKDMIKEAAKKEFEEMAKRREEEEMALLRKQTEYKAQPIKKYKDIKIQKSYKVTTPISPVFHTDRLRDKENVEH